LNLTTAVSRNRHSSRFVSFDITVPCVCITQIIFAFEMSFVLLCTRDIKRTQDILLLMAHLEKISRYRKHFKDISVIAFNGLTLQNNFYHRETMGILLPLYDLKIISKIMDYKLPGTHYGSRIRFTDVVYELIDTNNKIKFLAENWKMFRDCFQL